LRERVFLKSPVRENRTPGSVRGRLGNWPSYRDAEGKGVTVSWTLAEEVSDSLAQLLAFYNDRPHQGRKLDGLSPNEDARWLRLSATC